VWLDFAGKSARATFDPQPLITFRFFHQAFSYRVLPNVLHPFPEALISAKHVIEGFVLPHWPGPAGEFVDIARRGSLDGSQNLRECERPAICIAQTCKEQVHMIWHNHRSMYLNCFAVIMETVLQDKCSCIR